MFRAANLTREQFLGWIGRSYVPSPSAITLAQLGEVRGTNVLLIWEERESQTSIQGSTPLIALHYKDMREFFAFVGTYVSTHQPFTAFFRVASIEALRGLGLQKEPSYVMEAPTLLVGTLITEALLHAGEKLRRPSELSIQACLATMSSAAIGAIFSGLDRQEFLSVLNKWTVLRKNFSIDAPRVGSDRLAYFWEMVFSIYEGPAPTSSPLGPTELRIVEFLTQVCTSDPEATPESWKDLVQGLPSVDLALAKMRESREERIRAMDEVVAVVAQSKELKIEIKEIVLGYLASKVGGGSLNYLQLLQPVQAQLPLATMWLGLFTSIRNDSDVLNEAKCLGRRVARKLARRSLLFTPPESDISFDELETMSQGSRFELKFRTEHQGSITVELHPLVRSVFRIPRPVQQVAAMPEIRPEIVNELVRLVERLARTVNDLQAPKQPSLFADGSRKTQGSSSKSKRK